MTTLLPSLINAILEVCQAYISVGLASDPSYGAIYTDIQWLNRYPYDVYVNQPIVAMYSNGGTTKNGGLGASQKNRFIRVRVDVQSSTHDGSNAIAEQIRQAIITDYSYYNGDGTKGKGYLRVKGLKSLDMTEINSGSTEKRDLVSRKLFDLIPEIED